MEIEEVLQDVLVSLVDQLGPDDVLRGVGRGLTVIGAAIEREAKRSGEPLERDLQDWLYSEDARKRVKEAVDGLRLYEALALAGTVVRLVVEWASRPDVEDSFSLN